VSALGDGQTESALLARIRPGRTVTGMSAVLLPFTVDGRIDWAATEAHIGRTLAAGLTPAVNMDTGYVQLLDDAEKSRRARSRRCRRGQPLRGGRLRARCAGRRLRPRRYVSACEAIESRGGTPVIFPSHGLNALDDDGWVAALAAIGAHVDRFIGFELGRCSCRTVVSRRSTRMRR
jgi:hypothetical protein